MLKNIFKVKNLGLLYLLSMLLLSGCAGKNRLLLNTYVPPHKPKNVSQMLQSEKENSGFLELEIVDHIKKTKNIKDDKQFDNELIASLKKYITQTNFISISDVKDASNLALDMKILAFNYKETEYSIDGLVKVEFNIRKNGAIFYTQNYQKTIKRYSKAGRQGLPSKSQILAKVSDYLAKRVVEDISPVATLKLVELLGLPDEIAYTMKYAEAKNYKGAIKAMKAYKGEKEAPYYYDLAVYYEAYAAKNDNLALLEKANENYEKAMQLSKGENNTIIEAKAKFDNYYNIVKKVAEQKAKNAKRNNNSMFQIL